jgi:Family of unknown function (DUF6503)
MQIKFILSCCVYILAQGLVFGQNYPTLSGKELLSKTIAFHDPQGNWSKFHQKLFFHAKEPQDTAIYEQVFLDNRFSFFGHRSTIEGKLVEKGIMDSTYFSSINGDTAMTLEARKKNRLMPKAIKMARNSYLFLYGLPMKMQDKGIIIADEVKVDTFNKKNYYVLKADFEKGIGNDSWYLYINPTTFEMEGYRFYHNRKPNDGEFIICQGLLNVQGMKIPQTRIWYSNMNGEYIATDIVERTKDWAWKKKRGTKLD